MRRNTFTYFSFSIFLIFLVSLFNLSACKTRCGETEVVGGIALDLRVPASPTGSIIETEKQYYALFENRQGADTPVIDFSKHCLIGIRSDASGCDVGVMQKLKIDHKKKEYLYEVTTRSCGLCKMLMVSENWILAEKKPTDYRITFKTN
jgi:hypothetical protein